MAMDFLLLPLRATQFLLAIISLGLDAYVNHWYRTRSLIGSSPSQVNFLIFASVWTLLLIPFLLLTPRFFPSPHQSLIALGLEGVSWVFWLAGWVALERYKSNLELCWGGICRTMVAGIVFGALEWVLFSITLVLAAIHAFRERRSGAPKENKNVPTTV